jgi:response regulator RpfG family c-di-GMP phosphodiesterase
VPTHVVLLLDHGRLQSHRLRDVTAMPDRRRRRALVVDDSAVSRRVIARELQADYDVVLGDTVGIAIGLIVSEPFDVVVSDLDLGHVGSGVDVLHHARMVDIRIGRVLVTGSIVAPIIATGLSRALASGDVERTVGKPWRRDELRRAVASVAWRIQHMPGRRAPRPT